MSIIRYERDGIEFFTVTATGVSGMSISGLARLCGVGQPRVSEILEKAVIGNSSAESLQSLQGKDFKLSVSGYKNIIVIVDYACGAVIEYYALDARKPTPEAKKALRMFRDAGIRATIQHITGWQPSHTQPSRLNPYWCERLIIYYQQNKVPAGWWSIFEQTIKLVADLERCGYVLPEDQILDISIGKCWANHLRSNLHVNPKDVARTYEHHYPGWAHPIDAFIYPVSLVEEFHSWLESDYKPVKLPAYFRKKDPAALRAVSRLLSLPQGY